MQHNVPGTDIWKMKLFYSLINDDKPSFHYMFRDSADRSGMAN